MKGFNRPNQLFSLCGLNCGLCPMHLDKYCPGCGGGPGNQSCAIAKCSLEHGGIEYCYECEEYPCERYKHIDDFDSFITHKHQKADMEKARQIGIDRYNDEQKEKVEILRNLLSQYNDGRRKTFYCVAVNLLELSEVKAALNETAKGMDLDNLTTKEKSAYIVDMLQNIAQSKEIVCKLNKKK